MASKTIEVVVSGPSPTTGAWHWRPVDGSEGFYSVPAEIVDPEWTNGATVKVRVDDHPGGPLIVGVALEPSSDDFVGVLVNGRPFEFPDDRDLEPGAVVSARISFSRRPGLHDAGLESKVRPAVVASVGEGFLVVRAVYSSNTEARGRRLDDWQAAGLDNGSVVADEESLVSDEHVHGRIGLLTPRDRRRLGI